MRWRASEPSAARTILSSNNEAALGVQVQAPLEKSTRERILEVAETLFAERGFAATSTRAIAAAAGVALGQLHYHFPIKWELYLAIFRRRALGIIEQRLELLEAARAAYPNRPIPLRVLIDAFVKPYLHMAGEPGGRALARLHVRLFMEPPDLAREVRGEVWNETTLSYVDEFLKTLPHLAPEVVYWRLTFMIGVYTYVLLQSDRLEAISRGQCSSDDLQAAVVQMLPFLEAGLLTPAPESADITSSKLHAITLAK